MSLSYDTLSSMWNAKYSNVVYDNIFKKNHYLFRKLKDKAQTMNDRKYVQPLEYGNISNATWLAEFGEMPLIHGEVATAAEWTPAFLTDSLVISKKDELLMNSDLAVKNIIDVRTKNMMKGMELVAVRNFWVRSANSSAWLPLISLVSASVTAGGIAVADAAWWVTQTLDVATYFPGGDTEANLIDPTQACYLKNILQRGIAKAKYLTGEDPDVIVMPQSIWDKCEFILDPQKRGNLADEGIATMGFTNIKYRNSVLIADDDMTYAQTGDTDGYMYFLNTDYLYMYFNSGAKFKLESFTSALKGNYKAALCNAYGGMAISNRAVHCVVTGLASPKSYAAQA
jgi:hypothetical protein